MAVAAAAQADSEYEDEYESSEKDDDDDGDFEPEQPVLPVKLKPRVSVPAHKLEAEFADQAPTVTTKSKAQSLKKPKQSPVPPPVQPPILQNGDAVVILDDEADQKVSRRGRKKSASKAIPVVIGNSPAAAAAQAKDSVSQKKAPKKKASGKATAHDEAVDESLSVRARKLAEVDIVYAGLDKRTKQYKQLKADGKILSDAAAVKKAPAKKKKTARVESSDESLESEEEEEEEEDDDVEFIENPNLPKHEDNVVSDGASSVQSSTPLSQIWTTHVEDKQASASAENAAKTLVYKQDFVWDEKLFTNNEEALVEKREAVEEHVNPARDRPLGKRQMRSVQQSHIRQNLMTGNLDPHTMVQCETYRSKDNFENLNSRSRGSSTLEPPFQIQVHPDAVFVCDLHSHLATCEIIGFLGGRWDEVTKTLYIQAAFPCRSLMIDGDDGSTDVEMDPESEIELREIIQNAQLEVVGWYHSHPAFAPDPSIRDIENQTSYQQLFQRCVERKIEGHKPVVEISEPFVGLIVGTYDTKRDTPVSLFRYFHTRGEKVSGGARREIYMPYELVPTRRHYRTVLSAERRAETSSLPMYPSVFEFVFGKQSAPRMKSVELPKDNAVTEVVFAGIDPVMVPSKKDASLVRSRKRKLSSDLPVKAEIPMKKVKGKRGRKRKVDLSSIANGDGVNIDLTGEDVVVASIVDGQSATSSAAIAVIGENADEPIDVDVQTSQDPGSQVAGEVDATMSLVEEKRSAALSVCLRVAPKVNLPEFVQPPIDESEEYQADDLVMKVDEPSSVETLGVTAEIAAVAEASDDLVAETPTSQHADSSAAQTSSLVLAEVQTEGDVVYAVEPDIVAIIEESSCMTEPATEVRGAEKEEDVDAPEATQRRKDVQKLRKEVDQRKRSTSFDTAVKRRSTRHQKLPEAMRALVVDTKPVTIDLVDEDEGDGDGEAKAEENGSVEASSLSQDSNNGSAGGGRRRGRKPVQTQRKSTTFYNPSSTKDDRSPNNAQRSAIATQIEVYGAFGSASGVTRSGAEKENLAQAVKKEESSSVSDVVVTSVSEDNYVFLAFDDSKQNAKADEKPIASLLQEQSEDEPLKAEHQFCSSSLVVDSADEVIPESQSSDAQDEKKEPGVVVSVDDEVIPESQSQSPPVDAEVVADAKELPMDTNDRVTKAEDEEAALSGQAGSAIVIVPLYTEQASQRADDVAAALDSTATVKVEMKPMVVKSPQAVPAVDRLPVSPTAQIVKPEVEASTLISTQAVTSPASDVPPAVVTVDGKLPFLAQDNSSVLEEYSNRDDLTTPQSDMFAFNTNAKLSSNELVVDEPTPSDLLPIESVEAVPAQEAAGVLAGENDVSNHLGNTVCEAVEDALQPTAPVQDDSTAMEVDTDEPPHAQPAEEQMTVEVDIAQTTEASTQPGSTTEEPASMEIDGVGAPQGSSQPPATIEISTEVKIKGTAASVDVKKERIASAEAAASISAVKSEQGALEAVAKSTSTEVVDNEAKATDEFPVKPSHQDDLMLSEATAPVSPAAVKAEEIASVAPVYAEAKTCEELSALTDSAQAEAKSEVTPIAKPNIEPLFCVTNEVEAAVVEQPSPEPLIAPSAPVEDMVRKAETEDSDVVMIEPEADAQSEELPLVKQEAPPPSTMLFGSGRQVEDIRTSLDRIRPLVEKMIEAREAQQQAASEASKTSKTARRRAGTKSKAGGKEDAAVEVATKLEGKPDAEATDGEVNLFERQQEHLNRLRTRYGDGISGCAEQVITLVDYYRDFERRIDLNETWKAKVNKLSKIEASMSEYVRYVNLPVLLRDEFVQVRIDCYVAFLFFAIATLLRLTHLNFVALGCGEILAALVGTYATGELRILFTTRENEDSGVVCCLVAS